MAALQQSPESRILEANRSGCNHCGGAAAHLERAVDKRAAGQPVVNWQHALERKWAMLDLGKITLGTDGEQFVCEVQIYLNDPDPKAVRVKLYADGAKNGAPVRHEMTLAQQLAGPAYDYVYSARVPVVRPATDYKARVIPFYSGVGVPLEAARILWQQ